MHHIKLKLNVAYGVNRDALILILFLSVLSISYGFVSIVYQLYLKSVGYFAVSIGTLSMIIGVVSSLLFIPSGIFADVIGRRRIIIIGAITLFTGQFLIFLYVDYGVQLVSAILVGLGISFINSAGAALLADLLDENSYDKGFSLFSALQTLALTIAGILGWFPVYLRSIFYYSEVYSYRISGVIVTIIIGFMSLVLVFLIRERKHKMNVRLNFNALSNDKDFIIKFALINTIVGLGAGFSIPLFNYYLSTKFHVDSGPIGTLNALASFIMIPLYMIMPRIRESYGYFRTIILPQAISILLLMLIPISPNFIIASLFYIARQAFMNIPNPLISSFMMRHISPNNRATANAIIQMSWNLSNSITTSLGGLIMDKYLDLPLYITSGFYIVYVLMFSYFIKKYEKMHL